MKLSLVIIFSLFFTALNAQQKRALIVAVGNYPKESGISPIASLNDIKYIKSVLTNNQFLLKDIDTLKDAQATKAGILKALDRLVENAQHSDIVVVHFAMHGQQIRDQKTVDLGKDEEDGWDEALIPYDVLRAQYYKKVYEGENHLRDEELGEKLTLLRNKLGTKGSLLVLIDACHSGTATRASEFTASRGEPVPFIDPENPMKDYIEVPENESFFKLLSDASSNMVVFSGSGPHQQNYQVEVELNGQREQVGALTFAFYKAMNELPAASNYNDLFHKMKGFIQSHHPNQVPMAEGNLNQMVLSGKYLPKKESIVLTPIVDAGKSADTLFKLDKGQLEGLTPGAIVKIYDGEDYITSGTIRRADHFAAYGIAVKPLIKGAVYEARPEVMASPAYTVSIKLKTDGKDRSAKAVEGNLKSFLEASGFISVSDNADMMLEIMGGEKGKLHLKLLDAVDSSRWNSTLNKDSQLDEDERMSLMASIKNFRKTKYLRTLPDGGELAKSVHISLMSVSEESIPGEAVFEQDEEFFLLIKNRSREKLFYTVIVIAPDNSISVIYPTEGKKAADYSIEMGKNVKRKLGVGIGAPKGMEFLKVIVSKEPIDLRSVLDQSTTRSEMDAIQSSFNELLGDGDGSTRGEVSSVKAEAIGIKTVMYRIK
jgi:hypothetical protein